MNFLTFELAGPIGNMGDYRNVVSLVLALLITGVADAGLFYIFKRGFCRAYIAITEFLAIFSWLFGFDLVLLICLAILVIGCIVFFVGNSVEAKTLIANNLKGKTPGLNVFSRRKKSSGEALFDREAVYAKVQTAVITMAKQKVGAIITFERKDSLNDVMKSGTIINAPVSAELLQTIFYPGTRLHDGAVIIRGQRIVSAACVLNLAAFGVIKAQHALFSECVMKECSFFRFRWQDWTLRDCDMQRAEIHETAMKGMNVTSCGIEGIMADIPSIRGMTVTSDQAVQLAALLGLIVQ